MHNDRERQVAASRVRRLRELVILLDEAAAVQPLADEVVAACGEPQPVPPGLFRAGGSLQVTFYRLRSRLDELSLDEDLDDLREQARCLLLYHQWMLREALAATSAVGRPRVPERGVRINGLGAPANRLRLLRDEIGRLADASARRLRVPEPPDDEEPPEILSW
jgi:hypothetical protein